MIVPIVIIALVVIVSVIIVVAVIARGHALLIVTGRRRAVTGLPASIIVVIPMIVVVIAVIVIIVVITSGAGDRSVRSDDLLFLHFIADLRPVVVIIVIAVIVMTGTNATILRAGIAVVARRAIVRTGVGALIVVHMVAVVALFVAVDDPVAAIGAIVAADPIFVNRAGWVARFPVVERPVPAATFFLLPATAIMADRLGAGIVVIRTIGCRLALGGENTSRGRVARIRRAIIVILAGDRRMLAAAFRGADVLCAVIVVLAIMIDHTIRSGLAHAGGLIA